MAGALLRRKAMCSVLPAMHNEDARCPGRGCMDMIEHAHARRANE